MTDSASEASRAAVLVVDDSPAALAALEALLGPFVPRLLLAPSGQEALAHVEREAFALALIDVQMPGMSGFELARRIRRTDRGRILPLMMMTALTCDDALIAEGYAAGAADFVTKPFDPDLVRGRVRAFVELYQQHEAVSRALLLAATQERDEALRRLVAFERISTAALETSDLQTLLHELLRIFIAAADVADSAAILLIEDERLELRAHVGFGGESGAALRERLQHDFALKIAAERAPCELAMPEQASGARVVYGVPLIQAGQMLGVAQIASSRATEFTDIERRLFRAAADRAALAVARHLERSQLFDVLSAMPAAVAIARVPELEYTFASPAFSATCGGPLIGEQLSKRGLGADALAAVERAIESGSSVRVDELAVWPGRQDGTSREPLCFRFTAKPLSNVDGLLDRVLMFAVDVTDQVLARQTIEVAHSERVALLGQERQARRLAEQACANKDQFLTIVSHELRAPLSAILGWARAAHGHPDVLHVLSIIERNARLQSRIIEDLLDFSRIMRGKLRLDLETIDFAELLYDCAESLRASASEHGVELELVLEPECTLVGDGDRLQQVVVNLLGNAIKFSSPGGVVRLELGCSASGVRLTVEDKGAGIDPDFLPYVFEPFRQADGTTTRRHRGLGLGLSIAKQIVQAHGGLISAASDGPGAGAKFSVELPRDATRRSASRSLPPPAIRETTGPGKRIDFLLAPPRRS